jgi:hypothetical protein
MIKQGFIFFDRLAFRLARFLGSLDFFHSLFGLNEMFFPDGWFSQKLFSVSLKFVVGLAKGLAVANGSSVVQKLPAGHVQKLVQSFDPVTHGHGLAV